MKLSRKPWIFAALLCIALGLILTAVAFFTVGFHISGFDTTNYEPELTSLDKPYDKIVVDGAWCDVIIMTPGTRHAFPEFQDLEITSPCVLSYNSGNDIFTECGYSDRVLYISRRDLRSWYEKIGYDFNMNSDRIVLFLDDLHFDTLEVTTESGRIWLLSEAEIKDVQIQTSSGQLVVRDLMSNSLTMKSTSGNIIVNTSSADHILFESSSGDISLGALHAQNTLHAKTASGEIDAVNITSDNTLSLESTSVEIEFQAIDGADGISLQSTSGDIKGTLSSDMRFSVKTTSGDIKVPADVPGAPLCVVKTTSGDIEIKVE